MDILPGIRVGLGLYFLFLSTTSFANRDKPPYHKFFGLQGSEKTRTIGAVVLGLAGAALLFSAIAS